MDQQQAKWFERWLPVPTAGIVMAGLYLASRENYILFHSIAEIFSIIVGFCIFLFAWNSRRFLQSSYFVFLGIVYLSVGGLDILHMLAYKGMAVFPDTSANPPTQLWIASRYVQSISLLISPLFLRHRVNVSWFVGAYALIVAGILASILTWKIFPTCYIDGKGLTAFKIHSEYVIALIFLAAGGLLWHFRSSFDPAVWKLLCGGILISIASELAFTKYIGVYDLANLIGHLLKIVATYLVYKAILQTGFINPYRLLFRDLQQAEEHYRALFDHSSSGLGLFQRGADGQFRLVESNLALDTLTHNTNSGKPLSSFSTVMDTGEAARVFEDVLRTQTPIRLEQTSQKLDRIFNVSIFLPGKDQIAVSVDDITEQKRALEQERALIAAQERERMARDLHDAVSQTLFSANVIAEALPRLWKRDPGGAEQQLNSLSEYTRAAMAEMRLLLLELRPASLIQVELPVLLQQLCNAMQARKRIGFRTEVANKSFEVPPHVKLAFYRVAQESLNNVIKHSLASETTIMLRQSETGMALIVNDNGRGFDVHTVAATSMGLEIMEERASEIGASLTVDSAPNQGTRIVLSWSCVGADLRSKRDHTE